MSWHSDQAGPMTRSAVPSVNVSKAIVVIGLSVNATGNNVQAMLKAGAVFLLTKEAAVNELYRRMREVLMVHVEGGAVAR